MARGIDYQRLIIGYHGCDRRLGEKVLLEGGALKPSHNKYDWLGRGTYFWEHGPERALEWAREMQADEKIDEPFVLGAFIHLGRCLDLADTAATRHVATWYEDLRAAFEAAGKELPQNKPSQHGDHDLLLRRLDCAVLNYGLGNLDEQQGRIVYQTVRGLFPEGGPAFEGSRIMVKTHVQIAVRDPDCILGYFRPAR
ncbi:MAG: hypothetical protein ACQEXJ_23660 [Myxococcota bacterium]